MFAVSSVCFESSVPFYPDSSLISCGLDGLRLVAAGGVSSAVGCVKQQ